MSAAHVVYEPEWIIDERGNGSFRVECQCGWDASGFDTITRARSAGFDHSTGGAPSPAAATDASEATPKRRRRFWRS